LEFVKGCDLLSQIRLRNRAVKQNMVFYAAEVLCALEHLHNMNVMYRDLKPEHVLIDNDGHCKLVDLGFAKQFQNRKRQDMKSYTNCGTPDYIAPEVLKGVGASFQADIWSFGVLICEILSG
jgi:serine/threonine protein kinase